MLFSKSATMKLKESALISMKIYHNRKTRKLKDGEKSGVFLLLLLYGGIGVAVLLSFAGKSVFDNISRILSAETVIHSEWLEKARSLVAGHPIERMLPYIAEQNEATATYLVAIAKKESNWGLYAPKKDGHDCYNYWGYRGSENPTDSGYSCFRTPQQAVLIVGRRLSELIEQQLDTPRELVVWKRGFLDSPLDTASAKWVSDVEWYVQKLDE